MIKSIYFRPLVKCFLTLFVERSGSTYLATLLASHPDVLSRREEFAQLRQRGVDGVGQLEWARDFWTPPWFGPHRAIGFKSKLVDVLDPVGFGELLHERKVHVIQLQRMNVVKAILSTVNAKRLFEASGNWNLLRESDRLPPFTVDIQEFEQLRQERLRWDQELEGYVSRLRLPRLCLYYEDLLRDETRFVEKILAFIGVRPMPMHGKTLKNTSDNLREVILNFDDLRARYAGTPYHPMFDEVVP